MKLWEKIKEIEEKKVEVRSLDANKGPWFGYQVENNPYCWFIHVKFGKTLLAWVKSKV
jgi:hypothetical protein